MVDFLLGRVGQMTQGSPNTTFTNKNYFSLYAQDSWKVSRRLTLSYGVRWEPFLPQGINNGAVYNFSWDRFNQGVRSTVFKNAPLGLLYAGDPGFSGTTGVNNRFDQFGPRIGVAFDPNGDGKTSLRASFGTSYDFPNIQIMSTPTTAPPFGNASTNIPGPLSFADPWSSVRWQSFPGLLRSHHSVYPWVLYGHAPRCEGDHGVFLESLPATSVRRQLAGFGLLHGYADDPHLGNRAVESGGLYPRELQACPSGLTKAVPCSATTNHGDFRRWRR